MDIKKIHREVVIYIMNNKKQILLQKRSANKKYYPNKWALCTGHVEEFDKSYKDASIRELKEEVGLEVTKKDLIKLGQRKWVSEHNHTHCTYYYYVITNKKETDFIIQEEELSKVKWYDIDKVIDMAIRKDDNIIFTNMMLKCIKILKEK